MIYYKSLQNYAWEQRHLWHKITRTLRPVIIISDVTIDFPYKQPQQQGNNELDKRCVE